ncbi:UDP-N-acetylmuramoyl-L-alanyl-D-glutamate--2,6-diaminopimelate ligase [Iodobacter fluviatilis]|uniref:UDP-N-acetylmuramoyl-L-alanyl-D-glutamate--2,6-diaminopimelate ligase n=1 Tax=Iodobacter fluviatilis TaxID=537 RepID=A0A377SWW6_9NEIS|nr:UDP-N-acetylmuramoyl-L-alanyl-D-glutamate--2,6-diaminopimelate ligase [Iodobacter fluviatilis]TCU82987.1 UDP-N-acetylmuramoylalanyl-D-glutamate--2,6-diaminopimelate ligase [Iodobacter fluviatilis]STR45810.1 UDP-N-acetylmuramoyl-L-alanyl-D-glutamate--2,6-diaminopimelate ligase [Iodobacter fluviatilis]
MKAVSWNLPPLDLPAIDAIAAGARLVVDSRGVQAGDVFLAFQGEYADGRSYIADAIAAGAAAVLWEAEDFVWNPAWQTPNLAIPQLRAQAGIVAAHLLDNPSQSLFVTGITGTNGKTSIANWLAQAFNLLGHKTGVLGTLGNGFIDRLESSTHTTLDPVTLQGWLARLQTEGASHIAMEVSSHGLDQGRVHGTHFDVAVFTNLTRDHLDYHGDMGSYGAAKAQLFNWEGLKTAVINTDDAFGRELASQCKAPRVLTYGLENGGIRATKITLTLAGLELEVATPYGLCNINSPMLGRFNASNLLACLSVLLAADVPLTQAADVLSRIQPAAGRMQKLGGDERPLIVVDYAHTPDALEKALTTLRESMPEKSRLYCIFGCGGDRDKGKRPLMGEIACRLADAVIITSDNPRSETPQAIIQDIVRGVSGVPGSGHANYSIDSDRSSAISDAIDVATAKDVVLIAGKGHETYQEIAGIRHPFDDVAIANRALARKKK